MTTYKDLVGTGVTNFAGDNPAAVDGELWYDSSSKAFKYQFPAVTSTGSWGTGGNLNTARTWASGAGIGTAALAFGGSPNTAVTESYNGTSWTEVNDLNSARRHM